MSSKFLTFIFIILVSVQLSSCGWSLWPSDKKEESSTEKTTEKSFKDYEPNSSPRVPIEDDASKLPLPKDPKVLLSDNDEDESSSAPSDQPPITASTNVSAMPNKELDEYPEEESSKSPNSEKEIKSTPTSTSYTDPIANYVSSISPQITDSSTPTTGNFESVSPSTDNTKTPTITENMLNDNDDVNNVPRSVDGNSDNSDRTSVENSSPSSTDEIVNTENSSVGNAWEFITPNVTYSPNLQKVNESIDEDKEPTSNDQIGRKDKETHSSRDVTNDTYYSTQKITETSEIVSTSATMTDTPATTENMDNSTSNVNVPRNVNGTDIHDPSDLDPSASIQANTTIKTILSTSTDTMNTTEMAGSMSNGTTPEVNFGSFVNSGSTGNTYSPLILNLCILIFSISVIV